MSELGATDHTRSDRQRETMQDAADAGVCPFNPGHFEVHHQQPITNSIGGVVLDEVRLTRNDYPHDGYRPGDGGEHWLTIPNGHIEDIESLLPSTFREMLTVSAALSDDHGPATHTVATRSGDIRLTKASIRHIHQHNMLAAESRNRWQPDNSYEDDFSRYVDDAEPMFAGDYWEFYSAPNTDSQERIALMGLEQQVLVLPRQRAAGVTEAFKSDFDGAADELLNLYRFFKLQEKVGAASLLGLPTWNLRQVSGVSHGFAFHILVPNPPTPGADTARETAVRVPTSSIDGRRFVVTNKGVKNWEDDYDESLYRLK